eukprot:Nitzschia sp. Nitz4//scaffold195_size40117//9703//13668//NITZ4_007574-RA/size40117-processed-gene-0.24-mRNA-1//-1//CDS//3329540359//1250//frame0
MVASLLLWVVAAFTLASADIACESDAFCQEVYNSTHTKCLVESKVCSNPFQQGCLYSKLGDEYAKRLCNSDDSPGDVGVLCRRPSLEYPEVRIHQGNWDSGVFEAWIYQVLMMEVSEVPATVGLTTATTGDASFYSAVPKTIYSDIAYPYQAIERGNRLVDCTKTSSQCVHVLPEVWTGQEIEYEYLIDNDAIDPDSANGLLGKNGLHLPAYTLSEYPQLASWHGYTGEERRELLAEVFQRPTTWLEYCAEVSTSNCSTADDTAQRFPNSDEQGLYFSESLYTGFFQPSPKNDCTALPGSCTGHLVRPPCTWSTRIDQELYWSGIVGLEADGPLPPTGSYSDVSMMQIWRAANATKSHVAMVWYQPEALSVEFLRTEYEFVYVTFPAPTQECLVYKTTEEQRCSESLLERAGDQRGFCGDDVQAIRRLVSSNLQKHSYDRSISDAERSPAYEFYNNIEINNLDLSLIMSKWASKKLDPYGYDARDAVCEWIVQNLDNVRDLLPTGYPRTVVSRSDYRSGYLIFARVLGGIVCGIAIVCISICEKYKNTEAMVYAQPIFLKLILIGFLLIASGAILMTYTPSFGICVGSVWLILLGFTIELVPVLVKTAAINRLIRSSKKFRRVNVTRGRMMLQVAVVFAFVVTALLVWTVMEASRGVESYRVSKGGDATLIEVDLECSRSNSSFSFVDIVWQVLLLLIASVLAFQSRDVMKQLNDSKTLAMMVYSHFLFVIIRLVLNYIDFSDAIPGSVSSAVMSCNYSLDAFFAMCIYVVPKILKAVRNPEDFQRSGRAVSADRPSAMNRPASTADTDPLRLLVCTANMGNAAPTRESMESWIPAGGRCLRVTPLEDVGKMPSDMFDVVAIGMQEATWKAVGSTRDINGSALTGKEVLNAMDDMSTAELRDLVQEILGDAYVQIVDEQRGQMRLHLWALARVANSITNISISGSNTGIGNVLANKGGIVTTFRYKETKLSFLSAHLAAHEGKMYYRARCENLRTIFREAVTSNTSTKLDVANSSHHLFVLGDLNFRTCFKDEDNVEDSVKRAIALVEAKEFATLYGFDELQEGISNGDLLASFTTLPCKFPPTFKVERKPGTAYKTQRTPSYTDRILFKSSPGLAEKLHPLAYESCESFCTSDHKPVRGAFEIIPNQHLGGTKVSGRCHIVFRKMKCSELPAGDMDGSSDPYVMLIWDSNLLSGDVSLLSKLRNIWKGHSWPRTRFISKCLDPDWGNAELGLMLENCTVGSDQLLYVCVLDYDTFSKDDCLGVLVLNLRDLVTLQSGQNEKVLLVNEMLSLEGVQKGKISFEVHIGMDSSHGGLQGLNHN